MDYLASNHRSHCLRKPVCEIMQKQDLEKLLSICPWSWNLIRARVLPRKEDSLVSVDSRLSSRRPERKPLWCSFRSRIAAIPLVNWSSCRNPWQGWVQTWYPGWERDYGSVPSARIQKIQAVQDFWDIRKRFHQICKDLTAHRRFHVV